MLVDLTRFHWKNSGALWGEHVWMETKDTGPLQQMWKYASDVTGTYAPQLEKLLYGLEMMVWNVFWLRIYFY